MSDQNDQPVELYTLESAMLEKFEGDELVERITIDSDGKIINIEKFNKENN